MLNMLILTLKNKSFSLHGTFRNKFTKLPAIRLKNSACLIALKSYEKGGKNCLLIAYSGLFFIFIGLTSFKKKNKKNKTTATKTIPLIPEFYFFHSFGTIPKTYHMQRQFTRAFHWSNIEICLFISLENPDQLNSTRFSY